MFPIVGMGASAGGLEAVNKFFIAIPEDSGMAFVLVTHLDPTHISIMPELIQKHTKMEVHQAKNGMPVQVNCIYVIPPNKDMTIKRGVLQLKIPKESKVTRFPIDLFLHSLAQDCGRHAIGIILSGAGTDGTLGLKAIRENEGMVMVQDPNSARYDGMSQSAIGTGMVDSVLPPQEMPKQLIKYTTYYKTRQISPKADEITNVLQEIYYLIQQKTGYDFSCYKKSTICRRIERRMNARYIKKVSDYVRDLQQSPQEVENLFRELLIGVTSFFRDIKAYEILKQKILPQLFAKTPKDFCIRVWVPGCSSGEEAYSIAIILKELAIERKENFSIQVFATDIDNNALETARSGLYPESICKNVGHHRLNRFFNKEGNSYRVKKEIRELLVFATQNIISDPPFTKLDMICCRNLLIYLDSAAQKRLLSTFNYSLNLGGFLFLGTSETISGFSDSFSVMDKKWKLFKCKKSASFPRLPVRFPVTPRTEYIIATQKEIKAGKGLNITHSFEKMLLKNLAPACAIIDENSEILYIHGKTGKYLEHPPGKVSMNILEMAQDGLRLELSSAIRKVKTKKQNIISNGLAININGVEHYINLSVKPIVEPQNMQGLMVVTFEDGVAPKQLKTAKSEHHQKIDVGKHIAELEQELKQTKESLQTTIEEVEGSNEELQSTNEELETSKEELQSLNEEFITVNTELQDKIDELSVSNDDMKNLLDSTEIATIFLDKKMCVKRFTPVATQIINLIPTDLGRPVSHFASNLKYEGFIKDAEKVLKTLVNHEEEVETKNGDWFFMRILPYRTLNNVINGVVFVFEDITERKRAEDEREKLLDDMGERVKELSCMYGVAESICTRKTLKEIFRDIVSFIPPGWQYPEITCGRIKFDGKEYMSERFKETAWKQAGNIVVNGEQEGTVEVYYMEERPELDEGPFMKEERNLIDGISSSLSEAIERKQAEEELAKHREHLEELVEERTAELEQTHEQLLHAEKLGAIGKLSGSIAHEFNNPLFGIMNVLGRLKRNKTFDTTDKEHVDLAIGECKRIKNLISNLQDFNRPTSGVVAPMDIHKTLDDMLLLCSKQFKTRKIKVRRYYASDMATIHAVEDQIKQVILNLLNNADEAIPGNGGAIMIKTEVIGKKVAIHIHDSGHGIKPDHKNQIFEPFFTTKSAVKGTGLGLSVSYGIIKKHGGEITFKSEPGKGTTFTVTLPIKGALK